MIALRKVATASLHQQLVNVVFKFCFYVSLLSAGAETRTSCPMHWH
jgi:hypothetical protein